MTIFNRKKAGQYNILIDKYVPASLPSYGQGLENFVTADYPMNQPEAIDAAYHNAETHLNNVIATCDHHSAGSECDHYIDAETEYAYATHEARIANNENQIARIYSARKMRKDALDRKIEPLEEKTTLLKSEIEPLEGLRSQFQLHFGNFTISIGLLITIAAMIVDAAVNYSFLQTILLSNATLLMITVSVCLS